MFWKDTKPKRRKKTKRMLDGFKLFAKVFIAVIGNTSGGLLLHQASTIYLAALDLIFIEYILETGQLPTLLISWLWGLIGIGAFNPF